MTPEEEKAQFEKNKIPQERRDEIKEQLNERGVNLPCPRCGTASFRIWTSYVPLLLVGSPMKIDLREGAFTLPTAAVICNNCGHVMLHALGPLGLMPNKPEGSNT